jgi:hypothetical protein
VIDEAAADDEAPDPTITTQPAAPRLPSWDDMPLTATTTWHRVPAGGLQGYVEPNGDGALAEVLPANAKVGVVEKQGEWAQIRMGATTSWVDGRALIPPTMAGAPPSSGTSRTTTTSSSAPSRKNVVVGSGWSMLCTVAGVGVLVGAIVEWFSGVGAFGIGINSFDLPVQVLFDDYSLRNREPRIGYFLVAFGVIAILTSFRQDLTWVRRIAGVLTFLIAVRFCYQLHDSIPSGSGIGFFDVVGAGPLIAGLCGLALAVLPGP